MANKDNCFCVTWFVLRFILNSYLYPRIIWEISSIDGHMDPNPKKGKYSMPSTWRAKEIKTTTSPLLRVWHLLTSWIPKHTFIMFWNNISLLIVSNDVRRSLTIEVSPSLYDSVVEISPSIFWYWSFVLDMISRQPHRLLPMHLLNNTHKIHKIKYLTFYHMHSPFKMLSQQWQ